MADLLCSVDGVQKSDFAVSSVDSETATARISCSGADVAERVVQKINGELVLLMNMLSKLGSSLYANVRMYKLTNLLCANVKPSPQILTLLLHELCLIIDDFSVVFPFRNVMYESTHGSVHVIDNLAWHLKLFSLCFLQCEQCPVNSWMLHAPK